jgi:DNA (cytosine-5)-methyltransferase 1
VELLSNEASRVGRANPEDFARGSASNLLRAAIQGGEMKHRVVSLFTGIAGFETGFQNLSFEPVLMCEIDPAAAAVLNSRFENVDLVGDITELVALPECDVVVAGWPCQDLSQAGRTAGIGGTQSGLIDEVFRLIDASGRKPETVILENVAFALNLQGGAAIRHVVSALEDRGYRWAYRILDSAEFGLPQRRRRIFICACITRNPVEILFEGVHAVAAPQNAASQIGFYWTEGNRGIGWTPNAIPPLKGGSSLSIPSPPAVWHRVEGTFSLPTIEDAERLQGFPAGWTQPAADVIGTDRVRWRLVGNAVSVPVARWLGARLSSASDASTTQPIATAGTQRSHNAAFGGPGKATKYVQKAHEGPPESNRKTLRDFHLPNGKALSRRAANGFLSRYSKSQLTINKEFQEALRSYCT